METSSLIERLELVDVIEEGNSDTKGDDSARMIQLFALPEKEFHNATLSSQPNSPSSDFTGTRPYSGAIAFILFSRAFPNVFQGCDIIELGGGIGACGLLLAKEQQNPGRIVITDGEPAVVSISKLNRDLLFGNQGRKNESVDCCVLRWSERVEDITTQLSSLDEGVRGSTKFKFVIGSDLLYYKTDPTALISTASYLLDDECDQQGAIFLPALIRSATLGSDVLALAHSRGFEVYTLKIKKFVPERQLESIIAWYNITFMVLTRKGKPLLPELQQALLAARKCIFDPDASSSDEESDDDE